MDEMRMPSNEELAEIVYKYCQTNNITYMREDELVKNITDNEMKNRFAMLKENYNLDEKGYGEDEESSKAVTICMGNLLMFSFKLGKRFYDVIDILIEECKAVREKREGEKFYYLTFYLTPLEIESIKLVKSTIEILANDLYNYCKNNNIEYIKVEEIKNIIDFDDEIMIDKVVDFLIKKDMARIHWIEEECYLILLLTESKIALNRNMRLMIKNVAEAFLDQCNQNDITNMEKEELKRTMKVEDDTVYEFMLDYLVERHLADIDYNSEDGKEYVTIYP